MSTQSIGQKAQRVLKLLLGLRNARVAEALAAHGFTNGDLTEGWSLLQKVTRTSLDEIPTMPAADASLLAQLDTWENRWFPITDAALKRHAPEVHAWMFRNLSQAEGEAVVITVGTFLERLAQLEKKKSEGGFGPGGKEARKLLATRGITADVEAEAKELLAKLGVIGAGVADVKKVKSQKADFEQAEQALWDWYMEWSAIARAAIPERVLLKSLGFLKASRKGQVGEDEVDEALGDEAEAEGAEKPA